MRANGIIEQAARKAWSSLCTSIQLAPEQDVWLEFRPSRLRAAPIEIGADALTIQVSFDAESRIATHSTQPSCPFPERLVFEAEKPGPSHLSIPVVIDYTALREIFNDVRNAKYETWDQMLRDRNRRWSRWSWLNEWSDEDEAKFQEAEPPTVGSYWINDVIQVEKRGRALRVEASLSPSWVNSERLEFLAAIVGSELAVGMTHFNVSVMVEIEQDPEKQRISRFNIRLDTEASNPILDTVLELAEPWFLKQLEDPDSLDSDLLRELVKNELERRFAFAGLDDFSLAGLELGSTSVRALVAATGSIEYTVNTGALTQKFPR